MRIQIVMVKEFLHVIRDWRTLGLVLLLPIFLLLLFGYALKTDVKHISTIVCDQDNTRLSREFILKFENSGYFDIRFCTGKEYDPRKFIAAGSAKVGIVIPGDFSYKFKRGRAAQIQILIDGSDPTTAINALNYATLISQAYIAPKIKILDVRPRVFYNPELRSANFSIPGLIGVLLMNITLMLTSLTIVRERELKTMEQLIVTPIRPYELMIGKIIPHIIIGLVNIIISLFIAVLFFHVPIRGSILLLLLLTLIFIISQLGIGLFISTISRTTLQSFMTIIFYVIPSWLLSGFIFSIEAMPQPAQLVTYLVPLRYYLTIIRGITLKGIGFAELWQESLALGVFGLASIILSTWRFRKKL
jgi:ABC-2 type transport system permease protein